MPGTRSPAGDDVITAHRCQAQLLSGPPARTAVEVVTRLLAVQAQESRGARLAVRARSAGLSAGDVDHALTTERSLVVSWLNRGTLHLVRSEDYWWLHSLTNPQLITGNARRLAQEGVPAGDAERAVTAVVTALERDGPLTRAQLRGQVASTGVRTEGHALVHILALASLRGLIVRGPVAGTEQAFVLVSDWLGKAPAPVSREEALAELARRYLRGHGPATERDLAKWAGITLGDARRALTSIAPASFADPRLGLLELDPRREHPRVPAGNLVLPPPRLLGAFDPLLLGWVSRRPILGSHQGIVTTNGLFRPFALVAGRAVATWSMPAGQVVLAPFAPLPRTVEQVLQAEAADVRRFLTAGRAQPAMRNSG